MKHIAIIGLAFSALLNGCAATEEGTAPEASAEKTVSVLAVTVDAKGNATTKTETYTTKQMEAMEIGHSGGAH